ncbi:hypothetical protein GCK72_007645 [Caenorhabditis remanei]|uniref:C2H2-type domain-containing protein n=1 Tax=Caenorhabditis remanei TaxID=31234 RepID=A0A6A5HLY3_CAERE|nr:hypothetical protein GCK72_007645 [Caenorhabditis remanei]KAF1767686.1 hypothetical protein GCK72_007645 [Caenorhabditis remanei]
MEDDIPNIPIHDFQINEWDYHLYMPEMAPSANVKDNKHKIVGKTLEHVQNVRCDKDSSGMDDSASTVEDDIQIHDFHINEMDYHLYMPEIAQSGNPDLGNNEKIDPGHMSTEGGIEKENDVIAVTSSKTFKCKICDKQFKWAYKLKQHKLLHKGERRFECGVCHKTFPRAQALNVHKRLHSNEGQFECEVCGEKFNHQSNLCSHKLIHNDKAMFFECSICGKYVRDHIRSVHNMKENQLERAMKRSRSALSANVKNNEDELAKIFGKRREASGIPEHVQGIRRDKNSSDDFAGASVDDDFPVHTNFQIQSSQMDQNLVVTSIEDDIPNTPVHDFQISYHRYMPEIAQSALGDPDYVFTDDRIEKENEDTRLMMPTSSYLNL